MRLTKGQQIAGFPALLIRDMFHRSSGTLRERHIHGRLGYKGKDAAEILGRLVVEGYLESDQDRKDSFAFTELGSRLANASGGPAISRKKADELLAGVLERAEKINADPEYTWWVRELIVFGSYMDPSKEELGDVDIATVTARKPGKSNDDDEIQNCRDAEKGKQFSSFIERLLWQRSKVIRILKSGKRGISLHDAEMEKAILEKNPTKSLKFRSP